MKGKMDNKGKNRKNIGNSDYFEHNITPWDIWLDYKLDPFRADIVKRILRSKTPEDEKLDIEKIMHVCEEILRQMDSGEWEGWK